MCGLGCTPAIADAPLPTLTCAATTQTAGVSNPGSRDHRYRHTLQNRRSRRSRRLAERHFRDDATAQSIVPTLGGNAVDDGAHSSAGSHGAVPRPGRLGGRSVAARHTERSEPVALPPAACQVHLELRVGRYVPISTERCGRHQRYRCGCGVPRRHPFRSALLAEPPSSVDPVPQRGWGLMCGTCSGCSADRPEQPEQRAVPFRHERRPWRSWSRRRAVIHRFDDRAVT
jgi:hypothetical protein